MEIAAGHHGITVGRRAGPPSAVGVFEHGMQTRIETRVHERRKLRHVEVRRAGGHDEPGIGAHGVGQGDLVLPSHTGGAGLGEGGYRRPHRPGQRHGGGVAVRPVDESQDVEARQPGKKRGREGLILISRLEAWDDEPHVADVVGGIRRAQLQADAVAETRHDVHDGAAGGDARDGSRLRIDVDRSASVIEQGVIARRIHRIRVDQRLRNLPGRELGDIAVRIERQRAIARPRRGLFHGVGEDDASGLRQIVEVHTQTRVNGAACAADDLRPARHHAGC